MTGLALILDTETTGLDDPEVITLAAAGNFESPTQMSGSVSRFSFKPSKPISLGALATHHIIDEDLVDCTPWPGSWPLPEGVEYLIGHGIDYDWKAIGSPENAKLICTLALSRHLWPDLDSHSLTAMTYYLQGRQRGRELVKQAHSADHDVYLCSLLLDEILQHLPGMMSWNQLWEASEKARIPERLTFGKYGKGSDWAKAQNKGEGMRCSNVRKFDPGYYDWLITKCDQVRDDPYLRRALTGEAA